VPPLPPEPPAPPLAVIDDVLAPPPPLPPLLPGSFDEEQAVVRSARAEPRRPRTQRIGRG
jgi:hypothetical protein